MSRSGSAAAERPDAYGADQRRPDHPPNKEQFVTSLARGLAVLRAFGPDHPQLTLSQVAGRVGLSPAAARRFLLTLVSLGYLAHAEHRFVLTPRVLELSAGYLDSMHVAEVAQPHLQELRDRTGDGTSLTVLDGHDIIHVCHVPTQRMLRFAVSSGSRIPAYVSSSGRAMLAFRPEAERVAFVEEVDIVARTPHTVATPEALTAVLSQVHEQGYALVEDELDLGLTSIGVPILHRGAAVAGLSCSAVSKSVPAEEFVASRLPRLRAAAAILADQVGRNPVLLQSLSMS